MKSTIVAFAASAMMTTSVMGHATFQQFWVNGEDQGTTCARLPPSNSPVRDPTSNDMRCNANAAPASGTCPVTAGDTITVEMHQHNSRSCSEEAIGGAHRGPVLVYLSKVEDAATADGSGSWFKIFESGYDASTGKWGNDILNDNCGKQDVVLPADLAPGDYLVRAETIALHAAGGPGGAEFYMSCYQITVSGGGSAEPEGVEFPGAYDAQDPGILISIYGDFGNYVIPGPEVYESGATGGSGSSPAPAPTTTAAPSSAAPSATSTATAAPTSAPTPSTPSEPVPSSPAGDDEKLYTLDSFIAMLREMSGSSSNARRHARFLY
ncbi:hypothetical protein DL767_005136 [Monosporascus sp. MG133]|nr:hypothetical protein DL767_005136 [Monosporascus sp. MG133]